MDQASGRFSQAGRRTGRSSIMSCGTFEELSPRPETDACEAGNRRRALLTHAAEANQISRIKSRCTKLILCQRAYYFATCCRNVTDSSRSNRGKRYEPAQGALCKRGQRLVAVPSRAISLKPIICAQSFRGATARWRARNP
jgi:hypothetical protein